MSQQRSIWKDYLSASVRTGLKTAGSFVPGVAQAIDVIESVENRRQAETRHSTTLAEISRVERSVVEIIEREMKAVLGKLHTPNLSPKELQEEISNLYAMRNYGREPFLAEGLLVNSQWYEQLRQSPNLYGRVLQDRDVPSAECFYMFIDTEKTRMLEVSPFALQQLLSNQSKGAPEAKIIGQQDVFAERVGTVVSKDSKDSSNDVKGASKKIIAPPPLPSSKTVVQVLSPEDELLPKANAGDGDAMYEIGWMHDRHNDECKKPDDTKAFEWYKRSAAAGYSYGMLNLALEYESGRHVKADEAEALKWYKRAAEAGNDVAMDTLGWMYDGGFGCEKNYNESAKWYRLGADAGVPSCISGLGACYECGKGVGRDDAEAVRLFQRAINKGDVRAIGYLAQMHYEGRGGLKLDKKLGIEMYRQAIAKGDTWSKKKLKEIGLDA